ncbi:pheromone-processing carboxypeptidase KEX1-like [Selaginella moellendorffii]|nr:pheromone-processing carboxypeptidase KEX1-like [Selaginella moellendorffii]|eukprot:XP_024541039.1 pheromone-processing carboxypeptidase KEX1-like [Selaginella moellendorffii]
MDARDGDGDGARSDGEGEVCPICSSAIADVRTDCGHWFCSQCLGKWVKRSCATARARSTCPLCRHAIKAFDFDGGRSDGGDGELEASRQRLRDYQQEISECKRNGSDPLDPEDPDDPDDDPDDHDDDPDDPDGDPAVPEEEDCCPCLLIISVLLLWLLLMGIGCLS